MAALDVLYFLDGQGALRSRRDQARAAAVSAGYLHPAEAFPEHFSDGDAGEAAFPAADADMTGFRLEDATPDSFERDLEMMAAAASRVSVREEPDPVMPDLSRGLPDPEWT